MTGPPPVVAAQRAAVRAALADLPAGALVLVACSGGADSLALAAATSFVAPRAGLRAGAVVVDHGLQAGSDVVAERAAEACRALGLDPVEVVRVDVTGPGGPEAAARAARYTALEDAADRTGAAAVLLGHTLDDQAESVLLGLARGSGGRSLAGMATRRGRLRRPLLGVRRSETEMACALQGLEPWSDPTNAGGPGAPVRSRVRAEVMPVLEQVLGPGVAQALARTADQLREDADLLDGHAAGLLEDAVVAVDQDDGAGGGSLEPGVGPARAGVHVGDVSADDDARAAPPATRSLQLDVAVLAAAPAALRRRALRAACVGLGVPAGALHRSHVLALDALVVAWRGQGPVALPGGGEGVRRCGRLTVTTTPRHREQ